MYQSLKTAAVEENIKNKNDTKVTSTTGDSLLSIYGKCYNNLKACVHNLNVFSHILQPKNKLKVQAPLYWAHTSTVWAVCLGQRVGRFS